MFNQTSFIKPLNVHLNVGAIFSKTFIEPCVACFPRCRCDDPGMDGAIFLMLTQLLNFTYTIIHPERETWGSCSTSDNGDVSCRGLMDLLYRNVVDTTLTQFLMLGNRVPYVDSSVAIDEVLPYMLVRKPTSEKRSEYNYLRQQLNDKFVAVFAAGIFLKFMFDSVATYLLKRVSPYRNLPQPSLLTVFGHAMSSTCSQLDARMYSWTFLFSDMWYMCLNAFALAYLTTVFLSNLTITKKLQLPFTNSTGLSEYARKGLYHQIYRTGVGTPCASNDVRCKQNHQYAAKHNFTHRVYPVEEVLEQIATGQDPFYFYFPYSTNSIFSPKNYAPFYDDVIGLSFPEYTVNPSAWFFRKGFKYREEFNKAFAMMSLYTRSISQKYYMKPSDTLVTVKTYNFFSVDDHLFEAWMLLIMGNSAGISMFLLELVYHRWKTDKPNIEEDAIEFEDFREKL